MSEPVEIFQPSMFSPEDFLVSPTPLPVAALPPQTSAISGPSSPDSFANSNPDGSWRKTCQGYCQVRLDGSLDEYLESWPRAGMTRSGTAYRLVPSALLTDGIASGSWPTPCAEDAKNVPYQKGKTGQRYPMLLGAVRPDTMWPTPSASSYGTNQGGAAGRVGPIRPSLETMARYNLWPTPTARDFWAPGTPERLSRARRKSSRGQALTEEAGGLLNPTWVEWLMGFPIGWTDCVASATRSSRRSRNGSRGASSKRR